MQDQQERKSLADLLTEQRRLDYSSLDCLSEVEELVLLMQWVVEVPMLAYMDHNTNHHYF